MVVKTRKRATEDKVVHLKSVEALDKCWSDYVNDLKNILIEHSVSLKVVEKRKRELDNIREKLGLAKDRRV